MRTRLTENIKRAVRPAFFRAMHPRKAVWRCPICAYRGPFKDKTAAHRPGLLWLDSKCPRCGAVERHRLQSLVLDEVLPALDAGRRRLLHVAPEFCLQPRLREAFGGYESLDLERRDVDHRADLQDLPFDDGAYGAVFVSRVLSIPPDFEACLREMRRVLAPGGVAVVSEYYPHERTIAQDFEKTGFSRQFGVDAIDRYRAHFERVDLYDSDRYPREHQLVNRLLRGGEPYDAFPDLVRAPGVGVKELLAVCYA